MIAAWKWIKWIGIAVLVMTIAVLKLQLHTVKAEKTTLSEKLTKAEADNQINLTTIEFLKGESEQANNMLVQRQRQHIAAKEKLNADLAALKTELANVQCHIPATVTDRLRDPY
ncbi:hypothetical protein Q6U52_000664 [Vibrio alginolyticus]|nr:hypothetical protein [Vibrio alginolyticus]